jgi:hypothetical protein
VAVPPAPVRVSSQRSPVPSVTLVTSVAKDKSDNEMILGAVLRSPGICLTAEENPRKPRAYVIKKHDGTFLADTTSILSRWEQFFLVIY